MLISILHDIFGYFDFKPHTYESSELFNYLCIEIRYNKKCIIMGIRFCHYFMKSLIVNLDGFMIYVFIYIYGFFNIISYQSSNVTEVNIVLLRKGITSWSFKPWCFLLLCNKQCQTNYLCNIYPLSLLTRDERYSGWICFVKAETISQEF